MLRTIQIECMTNGLTQGEEEAQSIYVHTSLPSSLGCDEWYDNNYYVIVNILSHDLNIVGVCKPPDKSKNEQNNLDYREIYHCFIFVQKMYCDGLFYYRFLELEMNY